jgi:hypothetical protein
VVKASVKCIHCRSEDVVKMGKQPTNGSQGVNVILVEKPSKPPTKTMAPHLKLNK